MGGPTGKWPPHPLNRGLTWQLPGGPRSEGFGAPETDALNRAGHPRGAAFVVLGTPSDAIDVNPRPVDGNTQLWYESSVVQVVEAKPGPLFLPELGVDPLLGRTLGSRPWVSV